MGYSNIKKILQLFNFEKNILFIDKNMFYEGNFLYLKHNGGKANNKYKNEPYFNRLWYLGEKEQNGIKEQYKH